MRKSRIGAELLAGAVAGALFLGAGGRAVMRMIALTSDRPPGATASGTLTVVLWGTGIGLLGAVVYLLLERLLPTRDVLREWIFGELLALMAIVGLNREMPRAALLFLVVIGLYGVVMVVVARRVRSWQASLQLTRQ